MTEGAHSSSIFELHKQWTKLENEHHRLAIALAQAEIGGADLALLRDKQATLLLEINALVFKIAEAPANTLEDYLALLDVALEHETDLVADIAWYGAKDYPMLSRLFRALAETVPGFEFNSLQRWLSSPDQYEQLMGRRRSEPCDRARFRARRERPKAC
ncbi:MAG: hypothetical protein JOZ22_10185 [Acidobacteriia bacterium]|nr:hypothetical protein [Terriglobia bacterium]